MALTVEGSVKQAGSGYSVFGTVFKSKKLAEMYAWVCINYGAELGNKVLNTFKSKLTNLGIAKDILSVLDTDLTGTLINAAVKLAGYTYMRGRLGTTTKGINPYGPDHDLDEYVDFIIVSYAETGEPWYRTISKTYF